MRGLIVFSLLVVGCAAQLSNIGALLSQWSCSRYRHHDCDRDSKHEECGTNGVTYRNRCAFSKDACKDSDLHVDYYGACTAGGSTGNPVLKGDEAVLDFFCVQLSHEQCTGDEKVCGSDGMTYGNQCEFEKNKCTHRDLKVATFGQCSS